MVYVKQVWSDSPSTSSPINAAALNHMESGIYAASSPDTAGTRRVEALSAAGIQPWHSALSRRPFATARVACLGTSNTAGSTLSHWADVYMQRAQTTMRKKWDCPTAGGLGWIPAIKDGLDANDLVTISGGTQNYLGGYGYTQLSASGNNIVFSLPAGGTSVKLRYRNRAAGVFSWKIDSGAATNITTTSQSGNSSYLGSATITLPSDTATHTLTLTWVSGTPQINGIYHYNGDESSGIQIDNFGQGAATTSNFTSDGDAYGVVLNIADMGYQLIILEFQGNDISAGNTVAQYKANMQSIISYYDSAYTGLGKTPPAYLLTSITPGVGSTGDTAAALTTWIGYQTARDEIAAANPTRVSTAMLSAWLPVDWTADSSILPGALDPISGMPSNPTLVNQLYGSGHWNASGHALISDHLVRLLGGNLGQIG